MKNILYPILIAIFFTCSGLDCFRKLPEPIALPPITQEGKNTFGCLIDNKIFLATNTGYPFTLTNSGESSGVTIDYYLTSLNGIVLKIKGVREGKYNLRGSVNFSVLNFKFDKFKYNVNLDSNIEVSNVAIAENKSDFKYYLIGKNDLGEINFTKIDTTNGIVSGTFSFIATNENGSKKNITDGRFDIKTTIFKYISKYL